MKAYYDKILKQLDWWQYQRDRTQVFKDCIRAIALELASQIDIYKQQKRKEKLEELYIIYGKADLSPEYNQFKNLKATVTEMLSSAMQNKNFNDHLGNIYMQLIHPAKAKNSGQYFTPYPISKMMAMINIAPEILLADKEKIITINDPCCGAGGMLVAVCDILDNMEVNYAQQVLFVANDIDRMCVDMTYVQLSYLGASAIIEHKDTITQKGWDIFRTPAFLLIPGIQKKYKQVSKSESEM